MENLKSKTGEDKSVSAKRETFKIEGMSCASCANTVQRVLSRLSGVKAAEVNFSAASATVEYDPAEVSPAKMQETVGKTVYNLKE